MKRYSICSLIGLVFSLSLVLSSIVLAVPDTWTKKADMPTARYWLCTNAVNGKIYAIGGSTVEEYDTGFVDVGIEAKEKLATKWGEIKVYK